MAIILHFVFVNSVVASKGRVRSRVRLGGHDVPEADQERRYGRSLENAIKVIPLADESYFHDNSDRNGHRLVARFVKGRVEFMANTAPPWLQSAIPA